jgi:spore cortex biosynthesis protein YabQ
MALQTRVFFLSIGLGFLLGILYDLFLITRMIISKSKYAVYIQDIAYLLTCSFLSFMFIISSSSGIVRAYILGGELLGWILYYLSAGPIVVKFSTKIVRGIQNTIKALILLILRPVKFIFNWCKKIISKIRSFFIKVATKLKKNLRIRLKFSRYLLYNGKNKEDPSIVTGEGND